VTLMLAADAVVDVAVVTGGDCHHPRSRRLRHVAALAAGAPRRRERGDPARSRSGLPVSRSV
jgi:hypothetical protein